jgi:hypothetical protein
MAKFKAEATTEPRHIIEDTEKRFGGDGHKPAFEDYKKHAAGHQLEHERVKAMCGGGMTKKMASGGMC